MGTMFSAFRDIGMVAEHQSRFFCDAGLHLAAALRLSRRGKSPGLRLFGCTHAPGLWAYVARVEPTSCAKCCDSEYIGCHRRVDAARCSGKTSIPPAFGGASASPAGFAAGASVRSAQWLSRNHRPCISPASGVGRSRRWPVASHDACDSRPECQKRTVIPEIT